MRRYMDQSYLLRLWRDHADGPLRAMVVTIGAPKHHRHFANLDELQYFLITQTSALSLSVVEEQQSAPPDTTYCTPDSTHTVSIIHSAKRHELLVSQEEE